MIRLAQLASNSGVDPAMPPAQRVIWPLVYFALIPFVNWTFTVVQTEFPAPGGGAWTPFFYTLPGGGDWTPVTIVTGLVLVFRDFAQRAIGHKVLLVMLAGLAATIPVTGLNAQTFAMIENGERATAVALAVLTAGGPLAVASGAAFLISELADWAVYTFTGRPLHERIWYSSLIGAPLDSAVFLFGASFIIPGIFNIWSVAASIAGKLFAAWLVAELVRRRMAAKTG